MYFKCDCYNVGLHDKKTYQLGKHFLGQTLPSELDYISTPDFLTPDLGLESLGLRSLEPTKWCFLENILQIGRSFSG